jgi:hypothetical protein
VEDLPCAIGSRRVLRKTANLLLPGYSAIRGDSFVLTARKSQLVVGGVDDLVRRLALDPRIGYHQTVKIGKVALAENITLKQVAGKLGYVRPADFDRWVITAEMARPGATLPGGGG